LEELWKREGLTIEQLVHLEISDFIGQPDDAFQAAVKRVMEKNAELYRRPSRPRKALFIAEATARRG
jgi:hypothetical protein